MIWDTTYWDAIFVGLLLVVVFICFIKEWIPEELTALGALLVLALSKILKPGEALQGFANPAILAIASLFIVSAALVRTGIVENIGKWIVRISGKNDRIALALLLLVTASLSAFINNTPVIVVFVPICLGIAEALKISPSKLLIPIAFAATMGGMTTLIGTSTTVMLNAEWQKLGNPSLQMFELAPMALIMAAVGIIYLLLFSKKLLPNRVSISASEQQTEYLTELLVPENSSLIGKTLQETGLLEDSEVRILQWIRREEIGWPPFFGRDKLLAGDALLVRGSAKKILSILEKKSLVLVPELYSASGAIVTSGMRLAEVVVTPDSSLIGKTVEEIALRRRYHISVIAVQRRGVHLRDRLSQINLRVGDVLLVHGSEEAVQNLKKDFEFLLLEGIHEHMPRLSKAPLTLLITAGLIASITMHLAPIEFLALTAAGTLVLSGCLTLREAYQSINLSILLLIVGTLALGHAMEKTGLAAGIAQIMHASLQPFGPYALILGIYVLTNVLTQFLSNNAAALLMLPIAISASQTALVNPTPFLIAVAFAASLAFSVPTGYQVYMLVYGPGSYRFSDFVRVGLPLDVIGFIVAAIFLPIFWPL